MNHPHPLPHERMRAVLILINSHHCAGSWVMMTGWPVRSCLIYSFVRRDFQPHGAKAQPLHHGDRKQLTLPTLHAAHPHTSLSLSFPHYATNWIHVCSCEYLPDEKVLLFIWDNFVFKMAINQLESVILCISESGSQGGGTVLCIIWVYHPFNDLPLT